MVDYEECGGRGSRPTGGGPDGTEAAQEFAERFAAIETAFVAMIARIENRLNDLSGQIAENELTVAALSLELDRQSRILRDVAAADTLSRRRVGR